MPGYIDVNLSILFAVGVKPDEINLITGPVTIRLDPNKLPVIEYQRWPVDFMERPPVPEPDPVEARLMPVHPAHDHLIRLLVDEATTDKGFAARARDALAGAEMTALPVDERGGLIVTGPDEDGGHGSEASPRSTARVRRHGPTLLEDPTLGW